MLFFLSWKYTRKNKSNAGPHRGFAWGFCSSKKWFSCVCLFFSVIWRPVVGAMTSSMESNKTYWFSVCSDFSCHEDGRDDFQISYMPHQQTEVLCSVYATIISMPVPADQDTACFVHLARVLLVNPVLPKPREKVLQQPSATAAVRSSSCSHPALSMCTGISRKPAGRGIWGRGWETFNFRRPPVPRTVLAKARSLCCFFYSWCHQPILVPHSFFSSFIQGHRELLSACPQFRLLWVKPNSDHFIVSVGTSGTFLMLFTSNTTALVLTVRQSPFLIVTFIILLQTTYSQWN